MNKVVQGEGEYILMGASASGPCIYFAGGHGQAGSPDLSALCVLGPGDVHTSVCTSLSVQVLAASSPLL